MSDHKTKNFTALERDKLIIQLPGSQSKMNLRKVIQYSDDGQRIGEACLVQLPSFVPHPANEHKIIAILSLLQAGLDATTNTAALPGCNQKQSSAITSAKTAGE